MDDAVPFRALGTVFELVWEWNALGAARREGALAARERHQAERWVRLVLDEPPGMLLLRAALAASPHYDPDDLSDAEVVEEILTALERERLLVFQGSDVRGGGRAPVPPRPLPPSPGPGPRTQLSFYEITVVDENDRALAGLELDVRTPGTSGRFKTDAGGRVRLDREPPGVGSATVPSLLQLSKTMSGQETRPRRVTPLPTGEDWHVRTPRGLTAEVRLPDAEPQRLMIVTRADLGHFAVEHLRGRYRFACGDAGPWVLTTDPHPCLAVHSEGLGKRVRVMAVPIGEPTASASEEQPSAFRTLMATPPPTTRQAELWLELAVDDLVEALLRGDHDAVSGLLAWVPHAQPFLPPVQGS
ncbi:MAG: hypothetical protein HY908_22560 [Myxococcales bacterium]|nr:hypothetical protein [Myxococcales bacterium]